MARSAWVAPSRQRKSSGVWQSPRSKASPTAPRPGADPGAMARSSAPIAGARVRSSIREQVAARRLAKAGLRTPIERNHLLRRSVGAATEGTYRIAIAEFREWLGLREATTSADLDKYLPKYADYLFFSGEPPSRFRNALFGLMWRHCMPHDRRVLPRARQALTGFLKEAPEASRDPTPWAAALLVVHELLKRRATLATLAAACYLLAFDCYHRASEPLLMDHGSIVAPVDKDFTHWALVIARSDRDSNLHPSKTQTFDETVFVGTVNPRRRFLIDVVRLLHKMSSPDKMLFPDLTLGRYETLVREAALAAGLRHMKLSPHGARHGGPSEDLYANLTTLENIAARGWWKSQLSVRRYAKFGTLQRAQKKMGDEPRRQADEAARRVPRLLLKALEGMTGR